MTYIDRENSVQSGDPVYRFLFAQGTTEYAYTTEPYIVSDSTRTYTPAPIRPSEISQTNEMAKDPLKLEFPRDNAFAQLFLGGVPEQITTVTVFRGHVGDVDEEFQFYWKGRVSGVSATGDKVRIDCENIFTSMRRPGLRARYQKKCRHALYQTGCGLTAADFVATYNVTSVSGNVVTITELDSNANPDSNISDPQNFVGGVLETNDGSQRYIIGQDGNDLTLIRPISSLAQDMVDSVAGAEVLLYPGCDHTRSTCRIKFNNLANFGGFPWIPSKNPFRNKIEGSLS